MLNGKNDLKNGLKIFKRLCSEHSQDPSNRRLKRLFKQLIDNNFI